MRGRLQRWMRGTAAAALAVAAAASGPTTPAASAQPADVRAFAEIARCLNSHSTLDVLFLVDASSSLRDTDPTDARAEVLATSLGQLATARAGATVNFSMSTFGERYTNQVAWTKMSPEKLASTQRWLRNQVPSLDGEQATDWTLGLRQAQRSLAASPGGADACKILLWLTDGGINVPGSDVSVDADAIEDLCGVNPMRSGRNTAAGVIPSLRRDGVAVLGVLLKSTAYLQAVKNQDPAEYRSQVSRMSYMRPIVESTGTVDGAYFGKGTSTFTCGTSPIPETQAAGALIEVSDASDLGLSFARIWLDASGGQPGVVTGTNPFSFEVEPGVARVVVLLQGKQWTLRNPKGVVVAGSGVAASTPVLGVKKSAGVSVVEIATADRSALGTWRGEGPTLVETYLYSDLAIDLQSKLVQVGEPAALVGHITDLSGKPARLDQYGSAELAVTALGAQGAAQPVALNLDVDSGEFTGQFTPTGGESTATFDVTLRLTTRSGQALKPVVRRFQVEVALGAGYPRLAPARVVLSELRGPSGTARGSLQVTADAATPVQVCIKKSTVTDDPDPESVDDYRWTIGQDGCVAVPSGKTVRLPIAVNNPVGAEGSVQGQFVVAIAPQGLPTRELTVPFEFYRSWPPNELIRWLVLGLLSVLGIALPWLILHLLNRRNARLIGGSSIRRLQLPVHVSANGIVGPVGPGQAIPGALSVEPKQYGFMTVEDRVRTYTDATGVTLTGVAPRNPFGAPRVQLSAPAGMQALHPQLSNDMGADWFVLIPASLPGQDVDQGVHATLVSYIRGSSSDAHVIADRTAQIATSGIWTGLSSLAEHAKAGATHKSPRGGSRGLTRGRRDAATETSMSATGDTTAPVSSVWDEPSGGASTTPGRNAGGAARGPADDDGASGSGFNWSS